MSNLDRRLRAIERKLGPMPEPEELVDEERDAKTLEVAIRAHDDGVPLPSWLTSEERWEVEQLRDTVIPAYLNAISAGDVHRRYVTASHRRRARAASQYKLHRIQHVSLWLDQ